MKSVNCNEFICGISYSNGVSRGVSFCTLEAYNLPRFSKQITESGLIAVHPEPINASGRTAFRVTINFKVHVSSL